MRIMRRMWPLLVLLAALSYVRGQAPVGSPPTWSAPAPGCAMPARPPGLDEWRVSRAVDGDTVDVGRGLSTARVRLIGVDAPESSPNEKAFRDASRTGTDVATIVAMGKEATAFTRRYLTGRAVGLEYDVQRYDRYGRVLAYVWVGPEMFNVVIVREGYARVYTVPPNVRYASLFVACEREAREARRGLWR